MRAGREALVPPLTFYHDHDALLYRCALAYHLGLPLALHGHTGVGKTELVRYFAALLGAPLYRMNLHGLSTTDDIIGKLLPAGRGTVRFQDGLVTTAVRSGGILLLEEMNATGQEIWFSLHGLLDTSRALVLVEKDNEVVRQHDQCRIFATFNPAEYPNLYPGTKELSAAYLRRWMSVRMGFVDLELERAILLKRFPELESEQNRETLDTMLEVARVAREILMARTHSFNFVMSTGVLVAWASLALHVDPISAARMTFYDLLDDRMKAVFRDQIFAYVTTWDLSLL
jgi:MoxR-like ATPase